MTNTYASGRKSAVSKPLLKTLDLLALGGSSTDQCMAIMAAFVFRIACRHVPAFSCPSSPQKFTQPQLLTPLVLKGQMGHTYRSVSEYLAGSPSIRKVLGLRSVPNYSTFKRFSDRATTPGMLCNIWAEAFEKTRRFRRWLKR